MSHDLSHRNGWRRVVVACLVGGALCGVPASAQVTWDAEPATSGPQDGSGTWSTSDANWWNGSTDVVWPNLTTSSAIIGANSGAAGTITASGSLALNAITFDAAGSGTYTVTGGTLGFAGASPTITANADATIGSGITSAAGLAKNGTGNLTLSGSVSNTAGGISINRGELTLTGTLTNTSTSTFAIGSVNGGSLTVAGGSLSTSGGSARSVVIAGGAGRSGTVTVTSGSFSPVGMLVSEDTGGNGVFTQSGGTVSIGTSNLWLTGNTSSLSVSGGSFTNPYTTYLAIGTTNPSTSTISVSGSGSITLGTLNWGAFSRNGFTSTLNVGDGTSGGTFQVNTIASNATSVASTINLDGGTFVANGSIAMPSQISTVVQAGGANISVASAQTLTLGSPLTDGGGGGGLRKLGVGTLSLTGANTYTGTTSIAAGNLAIGNALALQNSTLDLDAADTGTVTAISQNSTLGGLTGSRNLDMLTRTLSIGNNNGSTTYSGELSNGAVTKTGSGTLALTGTNTYTGATTINAGILQIGNGSTTGSLSTSSAISGSAGAGLVFSRTDNYGGNVPNDIGGGIGLTLNSGTLALTGSNTYSGTTRINGGVLSLGSANALAGAGDVTFAGGTLQFTASNSEDFASRIKDSGSAIAIDTNGQNRTFAGTIDSSNTAGLEKSGAGTLVLSGSNTFSGGVTLTGGQVQVANASGLGTGTLTTNVDADTTISFNLPTSGTVANAITINKPGSNRIYFFQQNRENNLTLAGDITVASGNRTQFTLAGVSAGTYTLTGSNTFGADVFPGAGVTMRIGGTNAAGTGVWRPNLASNLVLLDGADFGAVIGNAIASYSMETAGTATVSRDIFNRDSANVAVNLPAGAQLTFSATLRAEGGSTTGTYTKTGAGTWVVNNTANQMTFNVQGGTMQVPSFSAIGPTSTASFLVLDGGTLRYTGGAASSSREFTLGADGGSLDASGSGAASFTSTAAVAFTGSGNRTLTLTGSNTGTNTLAMAINDSGADVVSLAKTGAGKWVLSGSNAYSGATTITAGTLALGLNGSFGSSSGITVGDAGSSNAALDLTAKTAAFALGAGQTLSGGGTVLVAPGQQFEVQGTFAPGNSAGLFTFDGGTTVLSGTTAMEIFGTNRATSPSHGSGFYDAVDVVDSGVLQFGGILSLEFSSLFGDDTRFDLFSAEIGSSLAGNFTGMNVTGSFYTGLSWTQSGSVWTSTNTLAGQSLEFDATNGQLVIVPEPGAFAIAGIGMAFIGWSAWRSRRAKQPRPLS